LTNDVGDVAPTDQPAPFDPRRRPNPHRAFDLR